MNNLSSREVIISFYFENIENLSGGILNTFSPIYINGEFGIKEEFMLLQSLKQRLSLIYR